MIKKHLFRLTCMLCLLLSFTSCSPKQITRDRPDKYGCIPPPASTFSSVGIDMSIAQSTVGKVVTGDIKIKSQPEVISLLSKSVSDQELRSYLRCLAINQNHYTPEQAAYLESMSLFSGTNPTPDQFQKWQDSNPFPKHGPTGGGSDRHSVSEEMFAKVLEITGGQVATTNALIGIIKDKDITIKEKDMKLELLAKQYAELNQKYEEKISKPNLSNSEKANLSVAKMKLDAGDLVGARKILVPMAPVIIGVH